VHIRRLRKGLDAQGGLPELVRTVRSAGYSLESDDHAAERAEVSL
jgi:two-component system, OmpR family, phosphate regulon response regulator PhoB